MLLAIHIFTFFFFNDTATTEIYTLSLHDALPILLTNIQHVHGELAYQILYQRDRALSFSRNQLRSEEHTSELQSQSNLVCRLLLEKKKQLSKQYLRTYLGNLTSQSSRCHAYTRHQ